MENAVVTVPAVPVRKKASHQNEMGSRLLFGETVKALKIKGNAWIKVSSMHDGWLIKKTFLNLLKKSSK